jgi:hypothetical protein
MTQKSVEILIGKLASDEALRARFHADPLGTIRTLEEAGLELTPIEIDALQALDRPALERLAHTLDPRLQKASLRSGPNEAHRQAGSAGA